MSGRGFSGPDQHTPALSGEFEITPGMVDFTLPERLEAHEPPEARGLDRADARLLVGRRGSGALSHHHVADLPDLLRAGDVLVVNTSATLPAAVATAGRDLVVHFSTARSDGTWLVELRDAEGTAPHLGGATGQRHRLVGGAEVRLEAPFTRGRLWVARVNTPDGGPVTAYLHRHGRPIRYRYVDRNWPLAAYQTIFATHPGSAEMPSAARAFTDRLVTRLVSAGIQVLPVLLHTGVASPEAGEKPYPEWYAVPTATARTIGAARAGGGRVVAVGTTVVRALESASDPDGQVRAATGWTDLVVTPERGVRVVDGLLTGWHEPRASHLRLLAAVCGTDLLRRCYAEALASGYLWHEFGDAHLLLP